MTGRSDIMVAWTRKNDGVWGKTTMVMGRTAMVIKRSAVMTGRIGDDNCSLCERISYSFPQS